ncbi:hypothetical protein [uncultured Pedobacter sp.]|uniref:hypothetical protein n=1 Tax=uncultured Pedobacter sp. TaxID=246139 RepID=UPI0025FD2159|nr:hypothetical protein [uncultured Pedobacter sp.]
MKYSTNWPSQSPHLTSFFHFTGFFGRARPVPIGFSTPAFHYIPVNFLETSIDLIPECHFNQVWIAIIVVLLPGEIFSELAKLGSASNFFLTIIVYTIKALLWYWLWQPQFTSSILSPPFYRFFWRARPVPIGFSTPAFHYIPVNFLERSLDLIPECHFNQVWVAIMVVHLQGEIASKLAKLGSAFNFFLPFIVKTVKASLCYWLRQTAVYTIHFPSTILHQFR